jgi:cysteine-rich repeat protein
VSSFARLLLLAGCAAALFGACGSDDAPADPPIGTGGSAGSGGTGGEADGGCPAGQKSCNSACVPIDDPAYGCGGGCSACNATNGTPSCADGKCAISCDPGFGDCDGDAANGCEVDLLQDPKSCGACAAACPTGESCVEGSCAPVCGDGVIAGSEACDDGNANNLDGCDAGCRYEAVVRMTTLSIEGDAAPGHCTPSTNRFGQVFGTAFLTLLNQDLADSVDSGGLNLLLQLFELDDLTGESDPVLSLGILSADRDARHADAWSKGAIDHWFIATPGSIDAQGKPLALVTGASIAAHALTVDAPLLQLPFAGSSLALTNAHLRAAIDAAADVPAPPPAKLAAGLKVLRTMSAEASGQGLCGNATVESLAKIALPRSFTKGGLLACVALAECPSTTTASNEYTWCGEHCGNPGDVDYDPNGCTGCAPERCNGNPVGAACNSLLDAIVGGCVVNPPDCIEAISPAQPDVGTGTSPPESLVLGANNKTAVKQGSDAYSAYFRFAANRAHLTNNLP